MPLNNVDDVSTGVLPTLFRAHGCRIAAENDRFRRRFDAEVRRLVNVRRDHQLVGPVSLYVLAVAESGERKTACDTIFGAALRDWERDRRAAIGPDLAARDAAAAAFEAKKAGILEAIKYKRRRAQDTVKEEQALDALAREAPVAVPVPRLLYADATPEALAHGLGTGWPTGEVLSAEAGAVFGSHGMGYETILRNLALLNEL